MLEEIINSNTFNALAGVVVGFFLSFISDFCSRKREQTGAREALFDEVRFNSEHSKNKIKILDQAIAALEEKKFLSTKSVHYSTSEFTGLYQKALPKLSNLERDNFRHLNSLHTTIDRFLYSFDESLKDDLNNAVTRKNTFESVYQGAAIQLTDIKKALKDSIFLSERLLSGSPVTIFQDQRHNK